MIHDNHTYQSINKGIWLFIGLFLVNLIFLNIELIAQDISQETASTTFQKSIQSPTVGAFAKYGEIPVNLYTGSPNISIPLYELNTAGGNLPISLSYDATGIKVGQVAGVAGLGWNLNVGGVITRTMQSHPDDGYVSGSKSITKKYQELNTEVWRTFNDVLNADMNAVPYCISSGCVTYMPLNEMDLVDLVHDGQNRSGAVYDTKPDIFSFNVAGLSGKFLLNSTFASGGSGEVTMLPNSNVKIKWFKGSGGVIVKFELIDVDGTKYIFDKVETATVRNASVPITGNEPTLVSWVSDPLDYSVYNSSWFLTSIEYPHTTNKTTFSYIPHNKVVKTAASVSSGVDWADIGLGTIYGYKSQSSFDSFLLEKIESNSEILNITYNHEDIFCGEFDHTCITLSNKTLNQITIEEKNGQDKILWDFGFHYFKNKNDNEPVYNPIFSANREAKLVEVRRISPTNPSNTEQPYKFYYQNTDGLPMNYDIDNCTILIGSTWFVMEEWYHYFSNAAVDYWGYYNGKDIENNHGTQCGTARFRLPKESVNLSSNLYQNNTWAFANREADDQSVKEGLLTKIVYPSGGSSEFEYEMHDYSWESEVDIFAQIKENQNPLDPNSNIRSGTFYVDTTATGLLTVNVSGNRPAQDYVTATARFERIGPLPDDNISTVSATIQSWPTNTFATNSIFTGVLSPGKYTIHVTLDTGSDSCPSCFSGYSYLDFQPVASTYSPVIKAYNFNSVYPYLGEIKSRQEADLANYTNESGGGVRIKKITSYAGLTDSEPLIRSYSYKETNPITGTLSSRSSGVIATESDNSINFNFSTSSGTVTQEAHHIGNESFAMLSTTHDNVVSYREVTELIGENGSQGMIRHVFASPVEVPNFRSNIPQWGLVTINQISVLRGWGRGMETRTEYYDSSGNLKQAIDRDYELKVETVSSKLFPEIEIRKTFAGLECPGSMTEIGGYDCISNRPTIYVHSIVQTSGYSELISETTTTFENSSDSLFVSKEYTYANQSNYVRLPVKIRQTNSDGTILDTNIEYAHKSHQTSMKNLDMLSQQYSTELKDGSGNLLRKSWTLWKNWGSSKWRPCEIWVWNGGTLTPPAQCN